MYPRVVAWIPQEPGHGRNVPVIGVVGIACRVGAGERDVGRHAVRVQPHLQGGRVLQLADRHVDDPVRILRHGPRGELRGVLRLPGRRAGRGSGSAASRHYPGPVPRGRGEGRRIREHKRQARRRPPPAPPGVGGHVKPRSVHLTNNRSCERTRGDSGTSTTRSPAAVDAKKTAPGGAGARRPDRVGDNDGMASDDGKARRQRLAFMVVLDGARPSGALGWVSPLAPVVTQAAVGAGHWACGRQRRALAAWASAAGSGQQAAKAEPLR
jgi:hypothetical protein